MWTLLIGRAHARFYWQDNIKIISKYALFLCDLAFEPVSSPIVLCYN